MPRGRYVCSHIIHRDGNVFGRGTRHETLLVILCSYILKTLEGNPSTRANVDISQKKSTGEDLKQDQPLPLRALLTRPVLLSVSNYAMIALLDMAAIALIPLVWSTPVELGGLALSPASIGLWLSGYGCLNGVIQFTMFPRVVGRLGPGRVILTSVAAYVIIYTMFPFQNLAARARSATVWLLIVLQLASICITDMGFSEFGILPQFAASLTSHRFGVHVHCGRCAEQALAGRYERTRTDGSSSAAHGRARSGGLSVCVLPG